MTWIRILYEVLRGVFPNVADFHNVYVPAHTIGAQQVYEVENIAC